MRYILSFILLILILPSCTKYPNGPSISLRSRTERVVNSWGIEQVLVNSIESTPFYTKYKLNFNEDASFSQDNGAVVLTGTWSLISNDDSLLVTLGNKLVLHRFKILKLKENSLWVIEDQNTTKYEWHLKTK